MRSLHLPRISEAKPHVVWRFIALGTVVFWAGVVWLVCR